MRFAYALIGALLLVVYASLAEVLGFEAAAGPWMRDISLGEATFWLCHLGIALPALVLMAIGVAPVAAPRLARAWHFLTTVDGHTKRFVVLLFLAALLGTFTLGRSAILNNLPVTDDENALRFGARIVAAGSLTAPALEPKGAFTDVFTYERDGRVMSMDFPGGILVSALAIVTRLDSLLFALLAVATIGAVIAAAGHFGGRRTAVIAALFWAFSPMVLSLSLTMHAHLVSRAFVALAYLFYARLVAPASQANGPTRDELLLGASETHAAAPPSQANRPMRDGLLLGASAGMAFLCRPFETTLLFLPVMCHLVIRTKRQRNAKALIAIIGAFSVFVVIFAWWNLQTTGIWYLQARFAEGVAEHPQQIMSMWERLASNLGFNLLMLVFMFLGPPALILIFLGVDARNPASIVLLAGVLLTLGLALAHDNMGVHNVGPIHYSECVVPLTILAALGTIRIFDALFELGIPRRTPALLLFGYVVLGMSLFLLSHVRSLRLHADIQATPFEAVAGAGIHHAVVVGEAPANLYKIRPEMVHFWSWVLLFPHPDPFFRDDIIYASAKVDLQALRARFPERAFYKMTYNSSGPPITLEPLATTP